MIPLKVLCNLKLITDTAGTSKGRGEEYLKKVRGGTEGEKDGVLAWRGSPRKGQRLRVPLQDKPTPGDNHYTKLNIMGNESL